MVNINRKTREQKERLNNLYKYCRKVIGFTQNNSIKSNATLLLLLFESTVLCNTSYLT